jgi:hypothetical protein
MLEVRVILNGASTMRSASPRTLSVKLMSTVTVELAGLSTTRSTRPVVVLNSDVSIGRSSMSRR